MNTVNEFVNQLVKIDIMEDGQSYGHYPFSGIIEDSNGKISILALALGGDVLSVYKTIGKSIIDGAKKAYFSLDFPPNEELKTDFVAVYSYENEEYNIFAIPYDVKNGETFDRIHDNVLLATILDQFKYIVSIERKKLNN
jgi:hypothetical protein